MPIALKDVSYTYAKKTPFERHALKDVSLTIRDEEYLAVAGHTGSGKSTLMQILNGLLSPSSGSVNIDGIDITKTKSKTDKEKARAAKRSVGLVFQYPENQLFEETVFADIAFGLRNQGADEELVKKRVKEAMTFVGLNPEKFGELSPFDLSGGEMRRVAIAGVIAMHPKYLVLDEPTAGLDPKGREELMAALMRLHKRTHNTVVLVTHDMECIAEFADKVFVLRDGEIVLAASPDELFADENETLLETTGLTPPPTVTLLKKLKTMGLDVKMALTADEGTDNIYRALQKGRQTSC